MSTYTSLKVELIATGDQNGQWGYTTNNNLQYALEEAITGSADVAFSGSDITLTLVNSNLSQTARNFRLNLTGTSGGARNLTVPAIDKFYVINNGLADAVTVRNATGATVTVPAGKSAFVFNDGVDVTSPISYAPSMTLGTALSPANGGTGQTTYVDGQLLIGNSTGNTLTKSTLTAGAGITIANGAGTIQINATGTSTVVNGIMKGNGSTISAAVSGVDYAPATTGTNIFYGNGAGGFSSVPTPTSVGSFLQWGGSAYVWNTAIGTGSVTLVDVLGGATGLTTSGGPVTTTGAITLGGVLNASSGGTGRSTLALNNLLLGNATSAVQQVAPGTAGNVLASTGSTWASLPPTVLGPSVAKVYFMGQF